MHFYEDEPTQITLNPLIEEDTEMISDDEPPQNNTSVQNVNFFANCHSNDEIMKVEAEEKPI